MAMTNNAREIPAASDIQALILDMDGVLWRGSQPIGELQRIFARIRSLGWRFCLATNNATLSIAQYVEKVGSFGVTIQPDQVVNSSQAAAHYLQRLYPAGGSVFVVGENGLVDTLAERGFRSINIPPDEANEAASSVLAVVAGMDRQVTYAKISAATRLIRSGVPFIGTNPDRTFPTPIGLVPGAGAILAAIETATDIAPVIVGKPSPEMYEVALERMGVSPQSTLVVGDRLETDIAGGQAMGCLTALVLSGVTNPEAAAQWTPQPDWIAPDLEGLILGFG
jgi:4-nitrophenyl phosphatase